MVADGARLVAIVTHSSVRSASRRSCRRRREVEQHAQQIIGADACERGEHLYFCDTLRIARSLSP